MRLRNVLVIAMIAAVIIYYVVTAFVLQPQAINKQSFYVRLHSDWNSYPGNIMYDVTNVWAREARDHLDAQTRLDLSKQANRVEQMHGKSYVLVHHGDSNCYDDWEPHYARFGVDTIRHHIEYTMGIQQNPDPNIVMYSPLPGPRTLGDHSSQMAAGYSQFIPVCTHKESTVFDYTVKINDESVGFDAYFVPSSAEQHDYLYNRADFTVHDGDGCSAENYVRFSGTCDGVGKDSGLLVVLPDRLSLPLTKVEIWLYERS